MIGELSRYKQNGNFFFKSDDRLSAVCNAPNNSSGIYIIYALENGIDNLIYIGISGRRGSDGAIIHRKDGLRGRFVTGKTDGILRKIYWPKKMQEENIEALHIYWFVTYGEFNHDFPRDLEIELLNKYLLLHGKLPRWNKGI